MAEDTNPTSPRPARPRSPPRPVVVEEVARLSPRVTMVTFAGPALAGFGPPRPGSHMKIVFPAPGSTWSPADETAPRPPQRTYTPRRFDPARLRLDVEFVHHGEGLAAQWAARAQCGDRLFVAGPGGGYDVPATASEIVLVADETALPAAGTILDALPPTIGAQLLCEIENAAEQRTISTHRDVQIGWLERSAQRSVPSAVLEDAVRKLPPVGTDTCWWIACEAAAMRRIKTFLLQERGVAAANLHTRGYWKLGQTAYPDHDYGRD